MPKKGTFHMCGVAGCDERAVARSMCDLHYARFRRSGSTETINKQSRKGTALAFLRSLPADGAECIVWPFAKSTNGYGVVAWKGRQTSASRVCCELFHGAPATSKLEAAHSCGNGHLGCVNPRHLSWKTPADNARDKIAHGTHPRGERHPSARLTVDAVREIRRRHGSEPPGTLAAEFGITRSYLWQVARGQTWGFVE